MSWNTFCNRFQKSFPVMEEIGLKKAVTLQLNGETVNYHWHFDGLSDLAMRVIYDSHQNQADMIELFLTSQVLANGPKIFEVDQVDFEMLIQMDINVPMSEYNQPFPTYIIQLPENFRKNRSVLCPQAGKMLDGHLIGERHEADFMIIHHEKAIGSIAFALVFESGMSIKTGFGLRDDSEIETAFDTEHKQFKGSMEVSNEEWDLLNDMLRAALNYSFLIDEVGARRVPSSHQDRLERHLEVARKIKDPKRILRAETELRRNTVKYELNQEVQLFKTVDRLPSTDSSGKIMPPHHRRGHYRMQPCGVGRSQRKRIRIEPIFVNKHLFLGTLSKTKVSYK